MKRWIHASEAYDDSVFDTTRTGFSYYDEFLTEKGLNYMQTHKNLTGSIEYMTPREYFDNCAKYAFEGAHSADEIKQQREHSRFRDSGVRLVDEYAESMQRGDKFPLCFINYANPGQEGLHRMYAAGEVFGWDTKFPVLVVRPYDTKLWNEQKRYNEINDYIRYTFKNVVKEADAKVSDWSSLPPANLDDILREAIVDCASDHEDNPHNIDVEVEIDGNEIKIYLSQYEGIDIKVMDPPDDRLYVDDMFKSAESSDFDIDEYIDNLDDDDVDIPSLFGL